MSDQLIVRTMKDDMQEMNAAPVAAPLPTTPAAPVPPPVPSISKSKHKKPEPPVFSLPSKKPAMMGEEGIVEDKPKQKKHVFVGIAYIVLFCAIVSGAVYAYMRFGTSSQVAQNFTNKDLTLFQAIPKEARAVVDYNMETDDSREKVTQMWTSVEGEGATAISGNPTNLTALTDIAHAYYVLLATSEKPFLLVSKTEGTKEYVSQQREEQVLEMGNWYVMHEETVESYATALSEGSLPDSSQLATTNIGANHIVRYGLSKEFTSAQFPSVVASAVGLSDTDALVFLVTENQSDGTFRASAQIAGNPPGEGVVEDTAGLISLIPGDISFARVGFNIAEDIASIEEGEASKIDTTVLTQPAIRQFMSEFTTPYAIFERKGSDGVQDVGLIMQLPSSLRQQVKIGEPIIEQALSALIPLIIGKTLGIQTVFNDALYNTAPLRYVNLNGQSQTLDYSVGDNFVLVASSREGMYALIDTSLGSRNSLILEEPWKNLTEKAASIIKNRAFIVGTLSDPALMNVLPLPATLQQVPAITSSGRTSTGTDIQIVLSTQ